MTSQQPATQPDADLAPPPGGGGPDRIVQAANGFMAAKYIFTALDLDLFATLGTGGATLGELAGRCGAPARTLRVVADALCLLGLLERDGERYRNAADAELFLSGRGPADLRPLLRYWDKVSYPTWTNLTTAVRTGAGVRGEMDAAVTAMYEAAVAVGTAPGAAALARTYDFGKHRRLLDAGGGVGTFLTAVLDAHPGLSGTLLDLPVVADSVRERLTGGPLAGRVDVVGADLFADPLPAGHDAILVAHVVHLFPPERNLDLLGRLRAAAPDGGRLLLVDWWLDPAAPHPTTVMAAGEFLTISGGGTYTVDEVEGWLRATGWRPGGHLPLVAPMSLVVAEAG